MFHNQMHYASQVRDFIIIQLLTLFLPFAIVNSSLVYFAAKLIPNSHSSLAEDFTIWQAEAFVNCGHLIYVWRLPRFSFELRKPKWVSCKFNNNKVDFGERDDPA
jgi:hypothetical protein